MLRRLLSLLLLMTVFAYMAEPVLGVLRDGEVHHESGAVAAVHQGQHGVEHGHEDGPLSHEHGPDHQHGTSADHCTHHHGATLTATFTLAVSSARQAALLPDAPHHALRFLSAPFRPPRA